MTKTLTVEEQGQVQAFLSFVYAKCSVTERRELWQQLNSLEASINKPWLVGGDLEKQKRRQKGVRQWLPH